MKYLITGATGLVGNNVTRLLLERGDSVRALVRQSQLDRSLANLPIQTVRGDITQSDTLSAAIDGVDAVIHCAAFVHLGSSQEDLMQAANVDGTASIATACRNAGVLLLYVSSVDALGLGTRANPANEDTPTDTYPVLCGYVRTKRAAEAAVQAEVARGLDAVIVNPVYMLGPWDWKPSSGRMLLEVARGWAKLSPPGGNDFVDVRDVALGILTACARGKTGRRYILGGTPLSYFDAWTLFAEITGAKPPWRNARTPMLWLAGTAGDLIYRLTGKEPDFNSAAVAMSRIEHHYSYARAAAELDYRPRDLRETVTAAWEWFVDHGYARKRS
ncbi:MAG: NAD-dependent epimerase/dehydratase family protein [Pirellulales bacterium]|nr:NAD-dependent epimerase/dehydratase family protein [Pirellulales bacterium]